MDARAKKDALREYKEREQPRGVFAVRCLTSKRAWVGASMNLEAARNSTWFLLRHGQHRDAALQAEWRTHDEATFQFDILETLDREASEFELPDLLKQKKREWAMKLNAPTLLP